MKNTALSSLVVLALLGLPRPAGSFAATATTAWPRPLAVGHPAFGSPPPPSVRCRTTRLHGLKLPDFLTRDIGSPKPAEAAVAETTSGSTDAIPPETTESALEGTAPADAAKEGGGEEGRTETQTLLQKVKQAGTAGAISYALWELGFWGVSIPVCVMGYREVAGHWPDFSNKEDLEKVGAEAFAFVNFARLAVPLRIGLALSTTPWIDENVVRKFMKKDEQ